MFRQFEENFLMASPNLLRGLQEIWCIFQDSLVNTFLTDGYQGTVKLEDFSKRQSGQLTETAKMFKGSIQEALEGVIGSTIDTMLTDEVDGEKKKYQKLMNLTGRMLHIVLLTIVENTTKKYASLFDRFLVDKGILPEVPQFLVSLIFSENNKISFGPSIEEFRTKLIDLLSLLKASIKDLPSINLPVFDIEMDQVSFDDCIEMIDDASKKLDEVLTQLFTKLEEFQNQYSKYDETIALDPEEFVKGFDPDGNKTLDEYRAQLQVFFDVTDVINKQIKPSYILGIFQLNCADFKAQTSQKMANLVTTLLNRMKEIALDELDAMQKEFQRLEKEMSVEPKTPEEHAKIATFVAYVKSTSDDRRSLPKFC